MRYFFSAGEPSGDLHAAGLIGGLRRRDPQAACEGFGGPHMAAAGATLLEPLAETAVVGLWAAVAKYPYFRRLLTRTRRHFDRERPDAVILVDYPGFNWHVAKAAKARGIPVHYYIAPQLWAWGGWRVAKLRRTVDHVHCSLPFEERWFRDRGVPQARFLGTHPFFDHTQNHRLDRDWQREHAPPDLRTVALLTGSRTQEVRRNGPVLLRAAARLAGLFPDLRFLVAGYGPRRSDHRPLLATHVAAARAAGADVELHFGRTPEIMDAATCAAAVSGSVSLELMAHRTPTAIVYRLDRTVDLLRRLLLRTEHVTLVNHLAGKRLFPEFVGCRDRSADVADALTDWLGDEAARRAVVAELDALARRYAKPGAAAAAADRIVQSLAEATALRCAG